MMIIVGIRRAIAVAMVDTLLRAALRPVRGVA